MRYLIILVFAFYASTCCAQFLSNKALYSRQNQLIFNTKTLIIADGDKYQLEEYYGGGEYFGLEYLKILALQRDTWVQIGRYLAKVT